MKRQIKLFWKPFVLFFVLAALIINWNEISWIFNYKAVSRYTSDVIERQKTESDNLATSTTDLEVEVVSKENQIEIPKLEITVPLIVDETLDDEGVYESLDTGVVFYPSSVLPGQPGQTIILGHSAPENWPHIKYDWVFSKISELETGDEIIVIYNNKEYTYLVTKTVFFEKGQEVSTDLTNSKTSSIILISCWPPGTDIRRIGVEAALK
jgi:LPXTG-site transpeptidase (sortase) family protein